jgi:hypothetical protein
MLTKEQLSEWATKFDPEQLARELLSVQPMAPDLIKNLLNDPLANALMNRFVMRQEYKKPL